MCWIPAGKEKGYGAVQVGSIPAPGKRALEAKAARGSKRLEIGSDGLDPEDGWYKVTETNGWRVAWMGCTAILCTTCRLSMKTAESIVRQRILYCDQSIKMIQYLAKKPDIDAIIVGAHWGSQFTDIHAERTEIIAKQMMEAGATAIIGNHPHVMQDAQHYTTKDGRKSYVAYSVGSLTSGLGSLPYYYKRRTSVVLFVELEKSFGAQKKAQVASIKYVPICEVKVESSKRKMFATAHTNGKCKMEEDWAIRLLGREGFTHPNDLPLVIR